MKTLNFPMDDSHYEALSGKRESLSKSLGKHVSWKRFLFLMEGLPDYVLLRAAKDRGYDLEDDAGEE